jgi:hypothetical protein
LLMDIILLVLTKLSFSLDAGQNLFSFKNCRTLLSNREGISLVLHFDVMLALSNPAFQSAIVGIIRA